MATEQNYKTPTNEKGQEYFSHRKDKYGSKSLVERKSRQLGNKCHSKKCEHSKSKGQCFLIREEERQLLFDRFWSDMDWRQRKTYVATVTISRTKDYKKNQMCDGW